MGSRPFLGRHDGIDRNDYDAGVEKVAALFVNTGRVAYKMKLLASIVVPYKNPDVSRKT